MTRSREAATAVLSSGLLAPAAALVLTEDRTVGEELRFVLLRCASCVGVACERWLSGLGQSAASGGAVRHGIDAGQRAGAGASSASPDENAGSRRRRRVMFFSVIIDHFLKGANSPMQCLAIFGGMEDKPTNTTQITHIYQTCLIFCYLWTTDKYKTRF
jgi:hypothetical protein